MNAQSTPAQKLIRDFSPKLVELTDKVLFGDVWERPQLGELAAADSSRSEGIKRASG
jgi:hypothetical protein